MDNQQRKTVGLDFIAGLFVGEGSFSLGAFRMKKDRLRITPLFTLQMDDRETMEIVAESLRLHGLPVYVWDDPRRKRVVITINGMLRVRRYCEAFIPIMTGTKKRSAEIVLSFIESRMAEEHKQKPYTEEQIDLVKELRSVNGNRNGKKTPL